MSAELMKVIAHIRKASAAQTVGVGQQLAWAHELDRISAELAKGGAEPVAWRKQVTVVAYPDDFTVYEYSTQKRPGFDEPLYASPPVEKAVMEMPQTLGQLVSRVVETSKPVSLDAQQSAVVMGNIERSIRRDKEIAALRAAILNFQMAGGWTKPEEITLKEMLEALTNPPPTGDSDER